MLILAIEASSSRGGVTIARDRSVLAEKISTRQRSHAEVMHPYIQQCLSEASVTLEQIDLFAVGTGPGSFTGIRVAANTVLSLAYCFNKPIFTINSLAQVAWQVPPSEKKILVAANAFRNLLYTGVFQKNQGQLKTLREPAALVPEQIAELIDGPMALCGDGHTILNSSLPAAQAALLENSGIEYPTSRSLAEMAFLKSTGAADLGSVLPWQDFRPLYLRASEAEEKLILK